MELTINDFAILKSILSDNDIDKGVIKTKGTSIKEIVEMTGLSYNKIYQSLNQFKIKGLIEYGLSRGREKTFIVTEYGLLTIKEIIGGEY